MPRRCCVPGCRSNHRDKHSIGKYVSCYAFPSDADALKKWLLVIGRQSFVPHYDSVVCAKHFEESSFLKEDMYTDAYGELKVFKFAKPKLKNGAVPSLFLDGVKKSGRLLKMVSKTARDLDEVMDSEDEQAIMKADQNLSDSTECKVVSSSKKLDYQEEKVSKNAFSTCTNMMNTTGRAESPKNLCIASSKKQSSTSDRAEPTKHEVKCNDERLIQTGEEIINLVVKKRKYCGPEEDCRKREVKLTLNETRDINSPKHLKTAGKIDEFSSNIKLACGKVRSLNSKEEFSCRSDASNVKDQSSNRRVSQKVVKNSNCGDEKDSTHEEKGAGKALTDPEGGIEFINKCGKMSGVCEVNDVAKHLSAFGRTKDFVVSATSCELKVENRESDNSKDGEDESPCNVQEWEGGWIVKEELFRGLGLVPRGVLHDQTVDRRHCVSGQRRVETTKRFQGKTAVFYPPGTTMFDTEKFIGEIQKRPAIYDVRSKVYSNRVAKLKYWHEVGKEMYKGWDILDQMERRTLVKELQIKWKSIRDHFMRQLKQNMNGEGPKKKKYVHFDQLQFLTANLGVKRPRHSYIQPKQEPEEEYMELTPELTDDRHFSFMTSGDRPDYDEHEVPVAGDLLPQQPEDLSYHPKDLSYRHHEELSYHKELDGDRMGNKMFLLSLLPIMERLPDHSNIRARLQLMEVLQAFVAHEEATHPVFYNYHDEKQSSGDASQQHSAASHTDSDT